MCPGRPPPIGFISKKRRRCSSWRRLRGLALCWIRGRIPLGTGFGYFSRRFGFLSFFSVFLSCLAFLSCFPVLLFCLALLSCFSVLLFCLAFLSRFSVSLFCLAFLSCSWYLEKRLAGTPFAPNATLFWIRGRLSTPRFDEAACTVLTTQGPYTPTRFELLDVVVVLVQVGEQGSHGVAQVVEPSSVRRLSRAYLPT